MDTNWSAILQQLLDRQSLTTDQTQNLMEAWLQEAIAPELAAAILIALQAKGVTSVELAAMAQVVAGLSAPLAFEFAEPLIDTCGTGGDGTHTFNISTATAFVVAAAGVPVAKHGGRSVSSKAGSADVLECLGINLGAEHDKIYGALAATGICFLFAPHWHPAMKAVAHLRRSLGVRTVFNLIGPLVNPLAPRLQVMGVYNLELVELMAETMRILGRDRAVVLHSREGMDEVGLGAPTDLAILVKGEIGLETLTPADLGLPASGLDQLQGGDVAENAAILAQVLQGRGTIAQTNVVALNSAIALWVSNKVDSWQQGLDLAQTILASGMAWQKLTELKKFLDT
ncbi:MAG: anthranilate phosphoribosyltransferase [Pseudanabaenaceae cyanobacterium bins.68]|nr:anthranilate phosphoribosyltransferase [Pseudanabaenaceae cyanobacterium bins.68]